MKKLTENALKGRKCCKCGSTKTGKNFNGRPDWRKDMHNKDWDGISYLCTKCDSKTRQSLPGSQHNIIKLMAKCRTGNLNIGSTVGKGIISQATVAKTLDIEDFNIKNDNFAYHIDMRNEIYGDIDVKAESLDSMNRWDFHTGRKIYCNTYICLGMNEGWENIDAVLIIPNEGHIINLNSIRISRYPSRKSIYDKFRTDAKPYRDIYQNLMSCLKDKKVFDIEDIKKWLNRDIYG